MSVKSAEVVASCAEPGFYERKATHDIRSGDSVSIEHTGVDSPAPAGQTVIELLRRTRLAVTDAQSLIGAAVNAGWANPDGFGADDPHAAVDAALWLWTRNASELPGVDVLADGGEAGFAPVPAPESS
jgi:hypothetical protein